MTSCRTFAVAFAACALCACSSEPADLGQSADILWWTDHETADLSDWTRDNGGGTWTAGGGSVQIAAVDFARSGNYVLRSIVQSTDASTRSAGIALRERSMPNEACYSAWFYAPAAVVANGYWLFFKFRSRTTASDTSSDVDTWDVDVVPSSAGGLGLSIYRHDTDQTLTTTGPGVPIARWFQLEACLRAANDDSGRLVIWLDGQTVFDFSNKPTMPSQYVEWNVGGVAQALMPASATIYVDDAAISTHQLGPDFPIFWRAR